jgi:hypothetical protein
VGQLGFRGSLKATVQVRLTPCRRTNCAWPLPQSDCYRSRAATAADDPSASGGEPPGGPAATGQLAGPGLGAALQDTPRWRRSADRHRGQGALRRTIPGLSGANGESTRVIPFEDICDLCPCQGGSAEPGCCGCRNRWSAALLRSWSDRSCAGTPFGASATMTRTAMQCRSHSSARVGTSAHGLGLTTGPDVGPSLG